MAATMEQIKKLRGITSAGIMDCKEALNEANGDIDEAVKLLRQKGKEMASKKAARSAKEGTIGSYIHTGSKIGVMVEVNCETDFVAKNDDFQAFVKDVAMQIAAYSPLYVSREEVPADVIEAEKDIFRAQIEGKPENVVEKIVDGKIEKYFAGVCLLEQAFIKDQELTVKEKLEEVIGKIGENIKISRFVRFEVGEE